ncbi:DUF1223 domain-containing protein [Micromonospora lupini]|uniref:DUF1223 domain-containing protein n=1 Tax=Micromonospora lupini str. Lupac 08 TaxID=1150864 RepID=I0L411_9ACTN|nr:DUF1223 domain-containing protein [Micromonospora lupini]CCH18558.1 conserved hypothetical protein [Micromonospora lupini str. Lupac 08]
MTNPSPHGSDPARSPDPPSSATGGGVAVVELFTSQGCNSCPPAEELLTEIDQDARTRGEPVFALGFHVDYWDDLGWPDQFADAAYTARQEAYARGFGTGGLYTPQMIVNGTVEFVGSDRRRAASAIASALTSTVTAPLTLSVSDAADGGQGMAVDYRVRPLPQRAVVNVAVVQRGLDSEIARGENAGRTLRQDNVVRAFASVSLNAEQGRVELATPPNLDSRRATVIGYVQREGDRAVLGATAVDLSVATG